MKKEYIIIIIIAILAGMWYVNTQVQNNLKGLDINKTKSNLEDTKMQNEQNTRTKVLMKTNYGDITIELFDDTMPITAGNFKKLVKKGFYDGIIFHRIIPNFMLQGGDPTGTGMGGPGYEIKDEFSTPNRNDRGTLSMANSGPNTGGSQFFLNLVNNNYLDNKHPVFGKVINGLDVADKIAKVKTDASDKPIEDVVMEKVTIIEE